MFLRKMKHSGVGKLDYFLGDLKISDELGSKVKFKFTGKIECVNCSRVVKKTFQQGYCYPCFMSLARCDSCMIKPELCHYAKGTCREPEWGEEHCLKDHIVYLSVTTGLKVGITRETKDYKDYEIQRWGDQGAVQAIELAIAPERLISGQIETALKEHVGDKTNWRKLITGDVPDIDLLTERDRLSKLLPKEFEEYLVNFNEYAEPKIIEYPVERYLEKAKTWNFEKTPEIEGELHGIKGQYLFIDGKALNIRKFSGYEISLSI